MFFGLTNSPATFQAMMNMLYCDTIRKHEARGTTIWIYMDDITIAIKDFSLLLHEAAVPDILRVTKENSLFFKLSKSTFHALAIDYLGVILEKGKTRMDPAKVSGVRDWPTPKCVKDVCCFHGFCNFYCTFITRFSKIALPLNALTKKGQPFIWMAATQEAFDMLKQKVTEAHNVAENGRYTHQSPGAKVSCASAKPTWAH